MLGVVGSVWAVRAAACLLMRPPRHGRARRWRLHVVDDPQIPALLRPRLQADACACDWSSPVAAVPVVVCSFV